MALTRREFLTRTGLATAASFLGPSFFRHPFVTQAMAETIGDRYFVLIFLDGGNDGLNTVAPYDNASGMRDAYNTARSASSAGGINLAPASLLVPTPLTPAQALKDANTGAQLGLHPGLTGLKNLFELGKVAVIQGCGYPDYSLSHEVSRLTWQTGSALNLGTGWLGRHMALNYGSTDVSAVCIEDAVHTEFKQTATNVLAISRLQYFSFPYDDYDDADIAFKRQAFADLSTAAAGQAQPTLHYTGVSGGTTLTASESYRQLDGLYTGARQTWDSGYEDLDNKFAQPHTNYVARDLREVAKIIYGVSQGQPMGNPAQARFFEISTGGYDTHSNQGGASPTGQHWEILQGVGDAIEWFYQDLANMGVANKVCVMVYSEFSRRIAQNDSGTDHGSQGPVFVIGGSVQGGCYGNHPNIMDPNLYLQDAEGNTQYSQAAGDAFRSTDFRDVYGTILKHWINMPVTGPSGINAILPADGGDPTMWWTLPNFDLGFV